MKDEKPANDPRGKPKTTDFGIFYPVGYLVVGFMKTGDAERVQRDLMTGGYDQADCLLRTCEQVTEGAQRNLDENTGFLARLGKSDEAVQIHLDAAKQGATFLLVYAPGDTDAARDECHPSRAIFVRAPLPPACD
ncbi:MAG: hypothetical protein ACR2FI_11360 [Burkholderiales bacterium]|nr:hypothetical protein [Pseudomonadota bacterium]